MVSIISLSIGADIDAIFEATIILSIIARLMLFVSIIMLYLGLIIPKWLKIILYLKDKGGF